MSLFIFNKNKVHPFCLAQIAFLQVDEALTTVFLKYFNFANVLFFELVPNVPEHTGTDNHAINLVENNESFYKLIYSLGPMKLETLATYIKPT